MEIKPNLENNDAQRLHEKFFEEAFENKSCAKTKVFASTT